MVTAALLEGMSTGTRWWLFAGFLVATVVETAGFYALGRRLRATGGRGYDDFQKLGTAAAQIAARQRWGASGLATARKAWLLDVVYPPSYALTLALLASLEATHADGRGWDGVASLLRVVAWLALAAGATDLLVENVAVAQGLWATPTDAAARVARTAGRIKWALGILALLAALAGIVVFV